MGWLKGGEWKFVAMIFAETDPWQGSIGANRLLVFSTNTSSLPVEKALTLGKGLHACGPDLRASKGLPSSPLEEIANPI